MEASQPTTQQPSDYLYQYAANLLANGNKSGAEVERLLLLKGLDADSAREVVRELEVPIRQAKNAQAKKDMLHGGLWCIGGAALTMAHIGFVGKSAKEMLPDSEFVKKVQQTMENHPEIRFYQTMSQADELIIPQTSAFADHHLDRHYAVDDIGHMTLLFSSRIANRIGHWLRQSQDQRIVL